MLSMTPVAKSGFAKLSALLPPESPGGSSSPRPAHHWPNDLVDSRRGIRSGNEDVQTRQRDRCHSVDGESTHQRFLLLGLYPVAREVTVHPTSAGVRSAREPAAAPG